MCGNGGRCMALFARHAGVVGERMAFAAVDGLHRAEVLACGDDAGRIALGMTETARLCRSGGGILLSIRGSPHYVRFVEDVERVDVRGEGRRVRNLPAFAGTGVNVVISSRSPARDASAYLRAGCRRRNAGLRKLVR